jgi:sec-independent protein translocase protein TatA
VLVLFGANRLPELARSLGSSVKEFKKGVNELSKDETPAKKDEEKKA